MQLAAANKDRFLTLERNCLKVWEYLHELRLLKRIHIKSAVKSMQINDEFMYIVGLCGKVLVLDFDGVYVTTIDA